MSEDRIFIATDHKVDNIRLASAVRIAFKNHEDKLKFTEKEDGNLGDERKAFMTILNEAIKKKVKTWSGSEVSKSDIDQLALGIVKELVEEEVGVEDGTESIQDILALMIVQTLKKYQSSENLNLEAIPEELRRRSGSDKDLVFASEDEAIQYLSDLTGDKIMIASEEE